jgi:hypothetical protein
MDSIDTVTKSEIEAWALPYVTKVVKEINDSNGKVTNFKRNSIIIQIMSKFSNQTRYDTISKDSIVTYSIPLNFEMMLDTASFFK